MSAALHELRELVRVAQHHVDRGWPQANEWLGRAMAVLGSEQAHSGGPALAERASGFDVATDYLLSAQLFRASGCEVVPGNSQRPSLASNQNDTPCCSACGSTSLRYHELVPATRPIFSFRDDICWLDSDNEELWVEGAVGACIDCTECCTQHALPDPFIVEWTREDYTRRYGTSP